MKQRRKPSKETRQKMSLAHRGKLKSKEWKEKIGKAHLGKKRPPFSAEWKNKISESMKKNGHEPPIYKKEKHWNWKGGISRIGDIIRVSKEYKLWREAVYKRDNYTCIWCGDKGNGINLNADHIKPFSLFPELRFAIDNGRTLCKDCHKKTSTWGNKARNYAE